MSLTWFNVQIQECDLHVGCTYKAPNYYGFCYFCGNSFGDFKLWRTSIETRIEYSHNICDDCAATASELFTVPIDRMVNTGLKPHKAKVGEV
ncbi:MAG: hypothetical protein H7237_03610 [Alkalinema sp. FL-bin-369]|nr:hypothetical protein [Leptolyngbyaceae cyanobacterium LF-bin-369]